MPQTATENDFSQLLKDIRNTLISRSAYSRIVIDGIYRSFGELHWSHLDDNDAFWTMLGILSYSNMGGKAAVISPWLIYLKQDLSDYRSLATQTPEQLLKLCDGATMPPFQLQRPRFLETGLARSIALAQFFRDKIRLPFAKTNNDGVDDKLAFQRWLQSFGDLSLPNTTRHIANKLSGNSSDQKIEGLGPKAVEHLLSELGLPTLKPDVVVKRILYRLDLIENDDPQDRESDAQAIDIGSRMAKSANIPIREVDILLVKYGQEGADPLFGMKTGICLSRNPSCNICPISSYCFYPR